MKRILDHDSHTGLTQVYHGNGDGTFTIQTTQDVDPYLSQNAQARSMSQSGWKGEMHVAAGGRAVLGVGHFAASSGLWRRR